MLQKLGFLHIFGKIKNPFCINMWGALDNLKRPNEKVSKTLKKWGRGEGGATKYSFGQKLAPFTVTAYLSTYTTAIIVRVHLFFVFCQTIYFAYSETKEALSC